MIGLHGMSSRINRKTIIFQWEKVTLTEDLSVNIKRVLQVLGIRIFSSK